jgi:hypothetical protein
LLRTINYVVLTFNMSYFMHFQVKRKILAAAEEGDGKSAKRARRLAEDSAAATGQRKMDSFVRTGQSTVHRASTSRVDSRKFI